MQLLELGVPNSVPLETLYVCQPPNVAPLVPARVVHVKGPELSEELTPRVPVTIELPDTPIPPTVTNKAPDKLAPPDDTIKPPVLTVKAPVLNVPLIVEFPVMDNPLVDVTPLHVIAFDGFNDIFVVTPSPIANRGADAATL